TLPWPDGEGGVRNVEAAELLRELAPRAVRGLVEAGVAPEEARERIDVVETRARTGRTGSAWQRAWVDALEPAQGRRAALVSMLERYLELSTGGRPVAAWPWPDASEPS
ncbi:MAG: glutamate--cysteine ligase, partial [Myxococcota bacterium]|nr:glutamate--cysteine ligase [Myxococcota bacterium]